MAEQPPPPPPPPPSSQQKRPDELPLIRLPSEELLGLIQKLIKSGHALDLETYKHEQSQLQDRATHALRMQRRQREFYLQLLKLDSKIQYYTTGCILQEQDAQQEVTNRRKTELGPCFALKDDMEQLYKKLIVALRDPRSLLFLKRLLYEHQVIDFTHYDRLAAIIVNSLFGLMSQQKEHMQLLRFIDDIVRQELMNYSLKQDPLNFLRANTIASKLLTCYSRAVGKHFLQSHLAPVLIQVLRDKPQIDLDPLKIYKQLKHNDHEADMRTREQMAEVPEVREEIARRIPILINLCKSIIDSVFDHVFLVPFGIRWICRRLYSIIEERLHTETTDKHRKSAVGGFFFLRFFVPIIIAPDTLFPQFKLSEDDRTMMTNISRVIEKLACVQTFSAKKDWYFVGLNPFLEEYDRKLTIFIHLLTLLDADVESLEDSVFSAADGSSSPNSFSITRFSKGDLALLAEQVLLVQPAQLEREPDAARLVRRLGKVHDDVSYDTKSVLLFRFEQNRDRPVSEIAWQPLADIEDGAPEDKQAMHHQEHILSNSTNAQSRKALSSAAIRFVSVLQAQSGKDEGAPLSMQQVIESDAELKTLLDALPEEYQKQDYYDFLVHVLNLINECATLLLQIQYEQHQVQELQEEIDKAVDDCATKLSVFGNALLAAKMPLHTPDSLRSKRRSTVSPFSIFARKKKDIHALQSFSLQELAGPKYRIVEEQQLKSLPIKAKDVTVDLQLENDGCVQMVVKTKSSVPALRTRSQSSVTLLLLKYRHSVNASEAHILQRHDSGDLSGSSPPSTISKHSRFSSFFRRPKSQDLSVPHSRAGSDTSALQSLNNTEHDNAVRPHIRRQSLATAVPLPEDDSFSTGSQSPPRKQPIPDRELPEGHLFKQILDVDSMLDRLAMDPLPKQHSLVITWQTIRFFTIPLLQLFSKLFFTPTQQQSPQSAPTVMGMPVQTSKLQSAATQANGLR